jgi:hypothetical protein
MPLAASYLLAIIECVSNGCTNHFKNLSLRLMRVDVPG